MLIDAEGRRVDLSDEENGHILVWGKSGFGKTYFLCRQMEEYIRRGKKVLLIDYSGSYEQQELEKQKFTQNVKLYNPKKQTAEWKFNVESDFILQKDVVEAIIQILSIGSYFQAKLLEEAIDNILKYKTYICIPDILREIEKMLVSEKWGDGLADNVNNLERLLTKLQPYKNLEGIVISGMILEQKENVDNTTILQFSDFSDHQRRFLTELYLSLLWKETFRQSGKPSFDVVILDEFQNLSVKNGSTLASMLREGRKKGLDVVLGTQFISNYGKEEIQTLQQVANCIIFQTAPKDLKFSAEIIDLENTLKWKNVLKNLRKGEAVVSGTYTMEKRTKTMKTPIIVSIEKEE